MYFKVVLLSTLIVVNISYSLANFTDCGFPTSRNEKWWSVFNGTDCYRLQTGWLKKTYNEAETYCTDRGAHLVSIHSEEEHNLLVRLVKFTAGRYGDNKFWLGLRRDPESGIKEQWSDSSAIDFVAFNETQDEPIEHCTYMTVNYRKDDGRWFHHNCGDKLAFACKISENTTKDSSIGKKATPSGECEQGWIRNENLCYLLQNKAENFENASNICRNQFTADLVSIHNESQQDFLTLLLGTTNETTFWLGGYKGPGQKFFWKSNEFFNYGNWMPQSPSYTSGKNRCVRMQLDSAPNVGKWSDTLCNMSFPFVCQKPISSKNLQPSTKPFLTACLKNSKYIKYRNSCFKVYNRNESFDESEKQCNADGAHLVSIADPIEQILLKYLIRRQNITANTWIGMVGVRHEYEAFHWIDQSPVFYTNWHSSMALINNQTQCISIGKVGQWMATSDCDTKRPYACKMDLVERSKEVVKPKMRRCPVLNATEGRSNLKWIDLDPELDNCYLFGQSQDSYGAAQFLCYLYGASMVSIHSQHEAKLLSALAQRHIRGFYRSRVWIGLHRTIAGGYRWLDESPTEYLDWAEREPNNGTNKMCVFADVKLSNWQTTNCAYSFYNYICSVKKVEVKMEIMSTYETQVVHSSHLSATPIAFLCIISILILGVATFYGVTYYQSRRRRFDDKTPFLDVLYNRS